jgi:type IV fimbrial biogenesis protein FimT
MKATPSRRLPGGTIDRYVARPGFARAHQKGFTILELLVTVAVAAVLTVIAVPSFNRVILSNRLSAAANDVVLAANTARLEAIKRNVTTLLCSDGAVYVGSCGGSGTRIRSSTVMGSTIKINGGTIVSLSFSPQGIARKTGTTDAYGGNVADLCTSGMSNNNHRVIAMVGGSILTTTTASGATCQ